MARAGTGYGPGPRRRPSRRDDAGTALRFYGGVSHGVEKRSKVRSRIVADQLVKLIKEADHVVIMGHRMSDLDAIGSAEGVLRICKICDVPAVIAVRRDATLASGA